jgi:TolA-binding protein
MPLSPILLLFLLVFSTPSLLYAAPPDQFSFAESLFAEHDHYRAITEFKRFLHYSADDPRAPQAQLTIAKAYIAGKRWQQADAALEKTWQLYPTSPQALAARRLYAQVAFDRQDYETARQRYRQLQEEDPREQQRASYQIGLAHLQENQLPEAQQELEKLPQPDAAELQQFLAEYRKLPRKSPALAGTLSALLPGAGQLYNERPKQAGVAFALNAAFIYGAIEAWNNENYAIAGILSLFEIGWYGGNIYNAMNNAHKINREREAEFRQQLQQRSGLSLGFRGDAPWLQARFIF